MVSTSTLKAFKKFDLEYFVREELYIHQMTNGKLAEEMGITVDDLRESLIGESEITEAFIIKLSNILGQSPMYWRNLDRTFKDWKMK